MQISRQPALSGKRRSEQGRGGGKRQSGLYSRIGVAKLVNLASQNHDVLTADEMSLAGGQRVRDHALIDMMDIQVTPSSEALWDQSPCTTS